LSSEYKQGIIKGIIALPALFFVGIEYESLY